MKGIFQGDVESMSGGCQGDVSAISRVSQRDERWMSVECRGISGIHHRYVMDHECITIRWMSGVYQWYVRGTSGVCQVYVCQDFQQYERSM